MTRIILSVCTCLLLLASTAEAQEEPTRFGFGVALSQDFSSLESEFGLSNFTFIMRFADFRIVPDFGYLGISRESTNTDGTTTSTSKSSGSIFRTGLTMAYQVHKDPMYFYYGLGFGLIYTAEHDESPSSTEDRSKTDVFIGPLLGAEYMFHEDFSLGGEIQLNYISLDQYDDNNESTDVSEYAISTRIQVVIRWYL